VAEDRGNQATLETESIGTPARHPGATTARGPVSGILILDTRYWILHPPNYPLTSWIADLCSCCIEHRASSIEHRASSIEHRASSIEHPPY
jgi:hypothetical protein